MSGPPPASAAQSSDAAAFTAAADAIRSGWDAIRSGHAPPAGTAAPLPVCDAVPLPMPVQAPTTAPVPAPMAAPVPAHVPPVPAPAPTVVRIRVPVPAPPPVPAVPPVAAPAPIQTPTASAVRKRGRPPGQKAGKRKPGRPPKKGAGRAAAAGPPWTKPRPYPDLGEGWTQQSRRRKGRSEYQWVAPDGATFKLLKKAREHVVGAAPATPAPPTRAPKPKRGRPPKPRPGAEAGAAPPGASPGASGAWGESVGCPELGDGWTRRCRRRGGSDGRVDYQWVAPDGAKFTMLKHARTHHQAARAGQSADASRAKRPKPASRAAAAPPFPAVGSSFVGMRTLVIDQLERLYASLARAEADGRARYVVAETGELGLIRVTKRADGGYEAILPRGQQQQQQQQQSVAAASGAADAQSATSHRFRTYAALASCIEGLGVSWVRHVDAVVVGYERYGWGGGGLPSARRVVCVVHVTARCFRRCATWSPRAHASTSPHDAPTMHPPTWRRRGTGTRRAPRGGGRRSGARRRWGAGRRGPHWVRPAARPVKVARRAMRRRAMRVPSRRPRRRTQTQLPPRRSDC